MNVKLKIEHVEVRNKLMKLVDFINSEDYYKLSDNKKKLIQNKKVCLEIYLSNICTELYADVDNITVPDFAFLGLMGSMFSGNFGFNPSNNSRQELTEKNFKTEPITDHAV